MSRKYTRGPWECTDIILDAREFDDESSKVVLIRSRRGDIAYAAHFATNGDPAEQHANARLIAAAPQMVQALEAVLEKDPEAEAIVRAALDQATR